MKNRFTFALPVLAIAAAYLVVGAAHGQTGNNLVANNAGQPKVVLISGALKHAGVSVTLDGPSTINNRVDSNAILNLDSHPIADAEATTPAKVQPVLTVTPEGRYQNALAACAAAKNSYKIAVKGKAAGAIARARQSIKVAQIELTSAKAALPTNAVH